MVYSNDNLTFKELLEKDNSFTIHDRNLQKLATEMYKVKNNLSPRPIKELFEQGESLTLRHPTDWVIPKVKTENHGKETIRYMGPIIWNLLPLEIRSCKSLNSFKEMIKEWKPVGCPCKLCLDYIHNFGYVRKKKSNNIYDPLLIV